MTKFALSVVWSTVAAVALATAHASDAADKAGNDVPEVAVFYSDETRVTLGYRVRFRWAVVDHDEDAVLTCRFDPTGAGPEIVIPNCPNGAEHDHLYPAAGFYRPRLTVDDGMASSAPRDAPPVTVVSPLSATITKPLHDVIVHSPLKVVARIDSDRDIAAVTAHLDSLQSAMTLDTAECSTCFSGTLDLSPLARGEYAMDVVAEDVSGAKAQYVQRVRIDRRPQLIVTAPVDGAIARPRFRFAADCIDDAPGCRVYITHWDQLQLGTSGPAPLDTEVDLSSYMAPSVELTITASDSSNQGGNSVRVLIHIEPSQQLVEIDEMPGDIIDAKLPRLMYVVAEGTGDRLFVRDRATMATTAIPVPAGLRIFRTRSWLTHNGAIFVARPDGVEPGAGQATLHHWDGTTRVPLGTIDSHFSLAVAGNYAIWSNGAALLRRDLAAGTTQTVSADARGGGILASGVVLFSVDGSVYRYDGTSTTTLASPSGGIAYDGATSDGTATLARARCCNPQQSAIVRLDDGEILRPFAVVDGAAAFGYAVDNGWYAYTLPNDLGFAQVWAGPTGEPATQRTPGGTRRYWITQLGQRGDMVVRSGGGPTESHGYYLSRSDGELTHVTRFDRRMYAEPDGWYASVGRSLFYVVGSSMVYDSGFEPTP